MDLNQMRDQVFGVMEEKGFHGIEHTQLEAITFRQIGHLMTEWGEARRLYLKLPARYNGGHTATVAEMNEELADIIIVALDLAGIHGLDMGDVGIEKTPIGTIDGMWEEIAVKIGQLNDIYRKTNEINAGVLRRIIVLAAFIMRRCGGEPMTEVETKMAINTERKEKYGVAA